MEDRLNQSRGLVLAELKTGGEPERVNPNQLAAINERIKPLEPLNEGDIHIRSMYIVSDQINSYGGRFPISEFPTLVELLIDSPVLVGHRKDSLPIGRTFHAEPVERDGQQWIKSSFYWLKSSEGAESLRENIDGGVVKECSIGFTFLTPECSLCGEDIRQCRHLPLETYIVNGEEHRCHFNYRNIQRVLETSLVYRGATPDTSISKELVIAKSADDQVDLPKQLRGLDELAEHESYLLIPSYDGIDINFRLREGAAVAWRPDGRKVDLRMFGRLKSSAEPGNTIWQGRLVGFRGKERCSRCETERYLHSGSGPVSRLTLYLYPNDTRTEITAVGERRHRIQPIRYRRVGRAEIQPTAKMLTTKRGVEILCGSEKTGELHAYLYLPNENAGSASDCKQSVTLSVRSKDANLQIHDGEVDQQYVIKNFNVNSFTQGRRFIADLVNPTPSSMSEMTAKLFDGTGARIKAIGAYMVMEIDDRALGAIVLRPARINGNCRFLCYRMEVSAKPVERDIHAH